MKLGFTPFIALLFMSSWLHASTVIWKDDFSGSSLDPHFSTYILSGFGVSQNNGNLVFSSNNGTTLLTSYIYTKTDQNGASTADGSSMYNFFNRPITIKLSDIAVTGTPTGSNSFDLYLLLGTPKGGSIADLTPRNNVSGAFARLSYGSNGIYTVYIGDRLIDGSAGAKTTSFSLIGQPTSMEFILNGSNWTLSLSGATFDASGATSKSGVLTQITSASLIGSTYFSMGIINYPNLPTDNLPYGFSISDLEIQSIPEPSSLGLAASVVIVAGCCVVNGRRRLRA